MEKLFFCSCSIFSFPEGEPTACVLSPLSSLFFLLVQIFGMDRISLAFFYSVFFILEGSGQKIQEHPPETRNPSIITNRADTTGIPLPLQSLLRLQPVEGSEEKDSSKGTHQLSLSTPGDNVDPAGPPRLLSSLVLTQLPSSTAPDLRQPSAPSASLPATADTPLVRQLKGADVTCKPVVVEAQGVCKKLKPVQKSYPCKKQVQDKVCEDVPTTIQKLCTKTFHEKKPFKCERIEYKNDCVQAMEKTKDKCISTVIKQESYPCPKMDYSTKCTSAPVLVPAVCKHEVQKNFQYPCERLVSEQQCKDVTVEVDQVCEEDVTVKEKYDCSKTVYIKKCGPASSQAPSHPQEDFLPQHFQEHRGQSSAAPPSTRNQHMYYSDSTGEGEYNEEDFVVSFSNPETSRKLRVTGRRGRWGHA